MQTLCRVPLPWAHHAAIMYIIIAAVIKTINNCTQTHIMHFARAICTRDELSHYWAWCTVDHELATKHILNGDITSLWRRRKEGRRRESCLGKILKMLLQKLRSIYFCWVLVLSGTGWVLASLSILSNFLTEEPSGQDSECFSEGLEEHVFNAQMDLKTQ